MHRAEPILLALLILQHTIKEHLLHTMEALLFWELIIEHPDEVLKKLQEDDLKRYQGEYIPGKYELGSPAEPDDGQ